MKFITQSFIKDFRDYLDGKECGNIIQKKWVDGMLIDLDSAAAKLGDYFQYIAFDILPKNKQVPQPEFMASKIKANKGSIEGLGINDMYDPYRLAHANASKVKVLFALWGFKVVEKDKRYTKGKHRGDVDLVVEAERDITCDDGYVIKAGTRFVIDLKYSGLLYDKWSAMGWEWTEEQKKYHGTQAKQYKFVSGMEVFFLVVSSTNDKDVKFFHADISEDSLQHHLSEANDLQEAFDIQLATGGFEPRPDYIKCLSCALAESCNDKHNYPLAKTVYL